MPRGGGPRARPSSAAPWQFLVRAVAVITGLTLLLIVDVPGAAFYVAWALIVLSLATEGGQRRSCTGGARAAAAAPDSAAFDATIQSLELVCQPDLIPFYQRWGFTDAVGMSRLMRRSAHAAPSS